MGQFSGVGIEHDLVEILRAVIDPENHVHRESGAIPVVSTGARTRCERPALHSTSSLANHRTAHAIGVCGQGVGQVRSAILTHIPLSRNGAATLREVD